MGYISVSGTKYAAPILALAALSATLGSASLADAAAPAGASTLTINVSGLRNTKGNVLVCVTANKKYFPDCSKDPQSHRARVSAKSASSISFDDMAAGTYAAALMKMRTTSWTPLCCCPRKASAFRAILPSSPDRPSSNRQHLRLAKAKAPSLSK